MIDWTERKLIHDYKSIESGQHFLAFSSNWKEWREGKSNNDNYYYKMCTNNSIVNPVV